MPHSSILCWAIARLACCAANSQATRQCLGAALQPHLQPLRACPAPILCQQSSPPQRLRPPGLNVPQPCPPAAIRAAATPSAAGANPPKHLDGTLLGDYGFDPLRLGSKDKDVLKYYREVGAAPC